MSISFGSRLNLEKRLLETSACSHQSSGSWKEDQDHRAAKEEVQLQLDSTQFKIKGRKDRRCKYYDNIYKYHLKQSFVRTLLPFTFCCSRYGVLSPNLGH